MTIRATDQGFEPKEVRLHTGAPAVLVFTRESKDRCVEAIRMPWREELYDLPLGEPVTIEIPDTSKAGQFTYSCWMSMLHGTVILEAP